jgi:type IV secretion system protein VirB3
MSEHLRTLPVHQSLIRPVLLLGAERELVLLTAVVAAVLVLSLERLFFALLGTGLWIVGLAALQRAAKIDPLLSRVYLRHIRYRAFYDAQSRVSARLAEIQEQLPC